jgi:hypothetical protein
MAVSVVEVSVVEVSVVEVSVVEVVVVEVSVVEVCHFLHTGNCWPRKMRDFKVYCVPCTQLLPTKC